MVLDFCFDTRFFVDIRDLFDGTLLKRDPITKGHIERDGPQISSLIINEKPCSLLEIWKYMKASLSVG